MTSAPIIDTRPLASEFPTVTIERGRAARVDRPIIDAHEWRTSTSFAPFDREVARAPGDVLVVRGDRDVDVVACEALTRYQRFVRRRNQSSRTPQFGAALGSHRLRHDVSKPLVKADLDHALDTWQWMLRLDPSASLTAQLAALFHDIERLESEAVARIEHRAPNYQAFKDAHASRGGALTFDLLRASELDETTASRVREIVARHEQRGIDPEIDLLNDADALSFFSLNSSGYLDYFGPEQTRKKIAYSRSRLGDAAKSKLALVRLRPDVRALFQQVAA